MTTKLTEGLKEKLINNLNENVENGIIERENADLLIKLIQKAENEHEAVNIAELGTTYKRTGFHFDPRLDRVQTSNDIRYLHRSDILSFTDDTDKPQNKLIIGDNYDALQQLLITHKGKIDIIYIDPPYGKDDMGNFADTNYDNAITRDNLLSMLYPRLTLARELLSDNGFFFCSIDDKNYAYVKCLMDEIFSEKCFINTFVWKKNSSSKTEKDKFTINTEYVLMYSKSTDYILNDTYKPLSEKTIAMYRYDDGDGRGKYRSYPLNKPSDPGPETTYDYVDNNGKVWECPSTGWRLSKDKIKALEEDNRLILTGNTLNEKAYWNERPNEGRRIDTLWNDLPENARGSAQLESIFGGEVVFKNPKPVELIKRCIDIADENAVVLDFFAGSGTTGHAVLELNQEDEGNREFILCTNNEITDLNPNGIAIDVTSKRLKRIMAGECYDGSKAFEWIDRNNPYGGTVDVYEIKTVADFETTEGKTAFDVIDETAYGLEKFESINDKIQWICENFEHTEKHIVKE